MFCCSFIGIDGRQWSIFILSPKPSFIKVCTSVDERGPSESFAGLTLVLVT